MKIAALDAQYREIQNDDVQDGGAVGSVACVTFEKFTDAKAAFELTTIVQGVESYTPGEFWRRELPCLLAALRQLERLPEIVIVDGYVWLDDIGRKGLGAHLHDALNGRAAVLGVAKQPFRGSAHAIPVLRGTSRQPLYITSEGIPARDAASAIASMHGKHRIPTLLKRVDQLCRAGL